MSELIFRKHLNSFLNLDSKPISRNERFRQLVLESRKRQRHINGFRLTYQQKKVKQQSQAALIASNKELQDFLDWIIDIQKALGIDDREYAKLLGVSYHTIYRYKTKNGHLPSIKTLNKLFALEKMLRIRITLGKNVQRI